MNYGYRCKDCGAFFNSNSRDEVLKFKMGHKYRGRSLAGERLLNACQTVSTGRGTVARPALARYIKTIEKAAQEGVK